jgi:hypothetical protein
MYEKIMVTILEIEQTASQAEKVEGECPAACAPQARVGASEQGTEKAI